MSHGVTDPPRTDTAADGVWLTIRSGRDSGTTVHVDGPMVLGRGTDCELVLDDARVSRRHAKLEPLPQGRAVLEDLGSGNGTFVNGERVERRELSGGEQLQLGDTVLASSREEPGAAGGATVLGQIAGRSSSAFHRVRLQRSIRRATILSGAALVAAAVVGILFATGVLGGGGDASAAVERVVQAAAPSTVLIEGSAQGRRAETGTGWVLDADAGLIVTNAHVVNDGETFRAGAASTLQPARVVAVAPCEDLAVLRVARTAGLRTLPLGSQSSLRLGETVVAVGYPSNAAEEARLTSTSGVVSVVSSPFREPALDIPHYPNVVQTDAALNPGNSGGPLLDLHGRLVAVNSAGRTLSPDGRIVQGQNYAIGVDRVKQVLGTLRTGHSIGWTGAGFDYLSPRELTRRGLPPGLLVNRAVPGTAAARAGLGAGGERLLVAVDGKPLNNSLAGWCDAVGGAPTGKKVSLTLLGRNGGAGREVTVALQ